MLKTLLAAGALAASAFAFAGTASAMPVDSGATAGAAGVTKVAWYCNANGRHCVRAPRAGYAMRNDCNWNGVACLPIVVAPPVVVAPPRVVVRPPVVVAPAPRVVVKPGKVVVRP
jgi:hypothetical protein